MNTTVPIPMYTGPPLVDGPFPASGAEKRRTFTARPSEGAKPDKDTPEHSVATQLFAARDARVNRQSSRPHTVFERVGGRT